MQKKSKSLLALWGILSLAGVETLTEAAPKEAVEGARAGGHLMKMGKSLDKVGEGQSSKIIGESVRAALAPTAMQERKLLMPQISGNNDALGGALRFLKKHPLITVGGALGTFVLTAATIWAWKKWKNRNVVGFEEDVQVISSGPSKDQRKGKDQERSSDFKGTNEQNDSFKSKVSPKLASGTEIDTLAKIGAETVKERALSAIADIGEINLDFLGDDYT